MGNLCNGQIMNAFISYQAYILLTPAQGGVLEDVGDAGVVRRVRLEADGEDIIAVVTSDMKVVGSSLVVLQVKGSQLELRDVLGAHQGEAV